MRYNARDAANKQSQSVAILLVALETQRYMKEAMANSATAPSTVLATDQTNKLGPEPQLMAVGVRSALVRCVKLTAQPALCCFDSLPAVPDATTFFLDHLNRKQDRQQTTATVSAAPQSLIFVL